MIFYRARWLAAISIGLLFSANSAFALDGADLLRKLNNAIVAQLGDSIEAQDVYIDGSTVVLKSVTYTRRGEVVISLGDVTMTGVTEQSGGYAVEKMFIPDVAIKQKDFSASAAGLRVDGLEIPANATLSDVNSIFVFNAHVGPVSYLKQGQTLFTIASADAVSMKRPDKRGIGSSFRIDGIVADLSRTEMPATYEAMKQLELHRVRGSFSMKSSWELSTGKYDLTEYLFDLENIGKLNVQFSFSGLTPAFYNTAEAVFSSMTGTEDDQDTKNAKNLLGLAFVQQLTLNSAQIRFDDASFTNRAFDYMSKLDHVTRARSANSFAAEILASTAQLGIPDLQQALSTAVIEYFNNPKSLTISATPANPVPMSTVIEAANNAKRSIPQMIGLAITSND